MNESPIDLILSRLERVKSTGPGRWSACCTGPLHNHGDKNPSLSIAVGDDGRVLLKCFAGCDVASIVAALGLELSDLFPPRPITHAGPIPPHQRPRISDRDLLAIIRREVCVIAVAGEELTIMPLSLPDLDRLRTATQRLFGVLAETARYG
ncbi:MAG: virulence-associated protein E [Phycisphaerales bacterium]|nr:virulence-associated protein E [Phycisphaerales bacterium]